MQWIADFMYALAQWLKTTPLVEFSLWISNTSLSKAVDKNFWVIPITQTIHILAIAAAFGSVVMINLRIFGVAGAGRTMEQTVRRFLPWIWWSLATLVVTGIVMIIGEPIRELLNPAFWTKMVLVISAALVSLWFQSSVRRHSALWDTADAPVRKRVRAGGAGVIALWCVIMLLGRWIAYVAV
jgi:hypothetical protein